MARYLIDASKSRVSIEARSSLHPIHTETVGLEGWLDLDVHDGRIQVDGARGHVEFPVVKLKSGNALEDKELQRRIDARRFPIISGELEFIRENGAVEPPRRWRADVPWCDPTVRGPRHHRRAG